MQLCHLLLLKSRVDAFNNALPANNRWAAQAAAQVRLEVADRPYLALVEDDGAAQACYDRADTEGGRALCLQNPLRARLALLLELGAIQPRRGRHDVGDGDTADAGFGPCDDLALALLADDRDIDRLFRDLHAA